MIFIQNKYSTWYASIMERAASRSRPSGYGEKHHAVPVSLGGTSKDIVWLTAREHFVAHLLLPKMLHGKEKAKMVHALWMMCNHENGFNANRYVPSSRLFEAARREKAEVTSKEHKGKIMSLEARKKISIARKGHKPGPMSDEQKVKLSAQKIGGKNPAAKPVMFQGQRYDCLRNASRETGITQWFITKDPTFQRV